MRHPGKTEEAKTAYRVLVGKCKGKTILGRRRGRSENKIKMAP